MNFEEKSALFEMYCKLSPCLSLQLLLGHLSNGVYLISH